MTVALVVCVAGTFCSSLVLAWVVRTLLAENRRLMAAVAAPSREAAQRVLDPPRPRPARSDEDRRPSIIGLD